MTEPGSDAAGTEIIAIDGAAGTGKTTSAALVAEKLGFSYVDSGAVYRAVALALLRAGISAADDARIGELLSALPLEIVAHPGSFRVLLRGGEVGGELRDPEVTRFSSKVATRPEVRGKVTALLREAARGGSMVVEGRDIGTVVFPQAVLKVYLTAEIGVRAERRRGDLERQGVAMPLKDVARELSERDRRDSTRSDSPLRRAEGALVVDTGQTDIPGQVALILEGYRRARMHRDASGSGRGARPDPDGRPGEGSSPEGP